MKIALAQVASKDGDVRRNVERHAALLRTVALGEGGLVVFPELSVSNYSPEIAGAAALTATAPDLAALQRYADETGTTVAVGAPVRAVGKPAIGLVVLAPGRAPRVIGKRHLHDDERPFFSEALGPPGVLRMEAAVGIAICYELSVPSHTADLVAAGAEVYVASAAKTTSGVAKAHATLASIACTHGMPALLVNSAGTCEGQRAGGRSVAIRPDGSVAAHLGADQEGVLIYETRTGAATVLDAAG